MASLIPKFVKKEIADGWVGETLRLMLLKDTHEPSASSQQFISDVVTHEITDAGGKYTPGGVAITGKASVADGNNYFFDAADVVIGPGATLNYRYMVLYKDTGTPGDSPIRAQIELTANQIVTNGTSNIQWNALGIIYIS